MHGTRWLPDDSPTELARVRQPAPPGIIVHNGAIADDEICTVQSIFCTTPARTVYDIGRRADCGQLSGARGIRQLRNALYPADGGTASMWVGPNGRSASSMTANNIGQTRTAMPRISSGWNTLPHKAGSSCESAHGSCDTTAQKSSRTSDARSFSTCRSPGRTSFRAGLPRPSAAGAAAGRSAAP